MHNNASPSACTTAISHIGAKSDWGSTSTRSALDAAMRMDEAGCDRAMKRGPARADHNVKEVLGTPDTDAAAVAPAVAPANVVVVVADAVVDDDDDNRAPLNEQYIVDNDGAVLKQTVLWRVDEGSGARRHASIVMRPSTSAGEPPTTLDTAESLDDNLFASTRSAHDDNDDDDVADDDDAADDDDVEQVLEVDVSVRSNVEATYNSIDTRVTIALSSLSRVAAVEAATLAALLPPRALWPTVTATAAAAAAVAVAVAVVGGAAAAVAR